MLSVSVSYGCLRSGVTGTTGTLLGTGGVGIFQLLAYCSLLRLLLVENIDLARSVVLRRKSARSPPLAIGMGSEMVGL